MSILHIDIINTRLQHLQHPVFVFTSSLNLSTIFTFLLYFSFFFFFGRAMAAEGSLNLVLVIKAMLLDQAIFAVTHNALL